MIKLIRSDKKRIEKDDLINSTKDKFKKKLSQNSNIVSIIVNEEETVLLDKEYSFLRIFNEPYNEVKTIGSRLGYISEKTKGRIGFEFPEDLILCGNKIIISDSGNNRLVILSKKYKYINSINLPDSPFKFIYYKDDLLIVSDFFRSVFFISLKFGYIGKYFFNHPLDFETVRLEDTATYIADEEGDIFELIFESIDIDEIAGKFNNKKILLDLLENDGIANRGAVRTLIEDDDRLILEYIKRTDDSYFNKKISEYIHIKINSIFDDDRETIIEIEKLSLEYFFVYQILSMKGDQESGNLIKEQKIFEIFEKIKLRRERFKEIILIKDFISKNNFLKNIFDKILKKEKIEIEKNIQNVFSMIEFKKDNLDDENLLKAISEYWLLYDEIKILFLDLHNDKINIRFLNNMFYTNILKDFYFNVSLLYNKSNELEKFYSYAEKELSLYSDKLSLMFRYVDILIAQNNYERALKILNKNIDKNKENINYRFYRIYKGKNEKEKAFFYLKKELELFPHKKELIFELLSFNMLNKDEIANLIVNLKETGDQVIDVNYNTAMALLEIGDGENGESFLNKELDLFPENKKAVLLKMRLILKKIPDISQEEGAYNCQLLLNYLKTVTDESNSREIINYFSVLNFVTFSMGRIEQLNSFDWKYLPISFSEQINIYISFYKFIKKEKVEQMVKEFDREVYLSSISCSFIAFDYFFAEAKTLFEEKETDKGFKLIKTILKYNPGNQEIFDYLDSLS